ncbi:lipase family protein [Nocardioides albus]|uniref:Alpha-beta hydrolase superfamily lysophospholipase n=1 Tax=Nocardioides albus TaxID=1841 RepID=A0A7W5A3D8_9ACTN|nr:lipase family protein [Nocardioides albus]MBB3088655.1 alpha-beta hydrolase superfamily lysophospholipase [Nocardioides albus]GGU17683.1 lipase [Nocardioides albus]
MKRLLVGGAVLTAALTSVITTASAEARPDHAMASAPVGGAAAVGEAFYQAPEELVAGRHGSVIRHRPLHGDAAYDGARNWLVLYRSVTPQGEPVAVSGTVAVPRGRAPEGGWPVISWLHGTTGTADVCAPSRDAAGHPTHDYLQIVHETVQRWVDRGYAVVATDYQGLGTDGPHSYLVGEAEGRAAADMVRAAHQMPGARSKLSAEWIAAGHSQGGHAAVFAADVAPRWTPELPLTGVIALAPGSQLSGFVQQIRHVPLRGITGFLPLIIRGVETTGVSSDGLLTSEAAELMKHAEDRCVGQLNAPDSWGALSTDQVFQPGADFSAFDRAMADNEPGRLAPAVPVFLAQGDGDTTVLPAWTQALTSQLRANGVAVTSETYAGVDHRGVVNASYDDATAWLDGVRGQE